MSDERREGYTTTVCTAIKRSSSEELKLRSLQTGKSVSAMVREAIEKYLEQS